MNINSFENRFTLYSRITRKPIGIWLVVVETIKHRLVTEKN